MRIELFIILVFSAITNIAQDRIYMQDGTKITCTVNEVKEDELEISTAEGAYNVSKFNIILIEYRNGRIELYNNPAEELATGRAQEQRKGRSEHSNKNFFSLNSLALSNADISAFYEHRPANGRFGLGLMSAYNFNLRCTVQNVFIVSLPNSKKNYDNGAFVNYYLHSKKENLQFHMGFLMKYTEFRFDKAILDSVAVPGGSSQILRYEKHKGAQLASILTFGFDRKLENNMFIRFFGGIGGFHLKGIYREEMNKELNKDRKPGEEEVNMRTLPKIYAGINIGFSF